MRFILLLLTLVIAPLCAGDEFSAKRQQMVAEIAETVRYTREHIGKIALDSKVMDVMRSVPRHEFVPAAMRSFAYLNQPLPIGHRQTISQPYIVALMTDLAAVNEDSIVLEVGTGSGYQAAVLAELVQHVYTIEIVGALGTQASLTLKRLNYTNVTVRIGDGYHGWVEHAPFDAIVVTAAPEIVPQALIEQLKPGGKLVIPVGKQSSVQILQVLEKDTQGNISRHDVLSVGFVPLTRSQ